MPDPFDFDEFDSMMADAMPDGIEGPTEIDALERMAGVVVRCFANFGIPLSSEVSLSGTGGRRSLQFTSMVIAETLVGPELSSEDLIKEGMHSLGVNAAHTAAQLFVDTYGELVAEAQRIVDYLEGPAPSLPEVTDPDAEEIIDLSDNDDEDE